MGNSAKLITYSGRVQGVGFRFTAHRVANRYDLTGYVRNLPDKSVEMFIQGKTDDLKECMADIAENFRANIRNVKVIDTTANPNYHSFNITY